VEALYYIPDIASGTYVLNYQGAFVGSWRHLMDWGLYTKFCWWTDELAEDSYEIGYCMDQIASRILNSGGSVKVLREAWELHN